MRKFFAALSVSIFATFSPVWAEPVTIAALGDSLTQGYGLPPEDGFVPQLQGWLRSEGADVTLINAGVSGDTTAGGAARVAWTLTPDVDALIVTLGGNDLLRGIAPEVSRANLSAILDAAQKAEVDVLLIGMQAPGNYGPEYKAAFDAIYPDLASQYGVQFAESFFKGLGDLDSATVLQRDFQDDGIHPNADGVRKIVNALGADVLKLVEAALP